MIHNAEYWALKIMRLFAVEALTKGPSLNQLKSVILDIQVEVQRDEERWGDCER